MSGTEDTSALIAELRKAALRRDVGFAVSAICEKAIIALTALQARAESAEAKANELEELICLMAQGDDWNVNYKHAEAAARVIRDAAAWTKAKGAWHSATYLSDRAAIKAAYDALEAESQNLCQSVAALLKAQGEQG